MNAISALHSTTSCWDHTRSALDLKPCFMLHMGITYSKTRPEIFIFNFHSRNLKPSAYPVALCFLSHQKRTNYTQIHKIITTRKLARKISSTGLNTSLSVTACKILEVHFISTLLAIIFSEEGLSRTYLKFSSSANKVPESLKSVLLHYPCIHLFN